MTLAAPSDQLLLDLDWGREPWHGFTPRALTSGYLRFVDKSRMFAKPATVAEEFTDPAQLMISIHGEPNGS